MFRTKDMQRETATEEHYALVHHHQATSFRDDLPSPDSVLTSLGLTDLTSDISLENIPMMSSASEDEDRSSVDLHTNPQTSLPRRVLMP